MIIISPIYVTMVMLNESVQEKMDIGKFCRCSRSGGLHCRLLLEREAFIIALIGTKICPVCGKEFKGLGNICKDGDYCNECEKKVRLVFANDEEDHLSAAAIREKLDKYADAIAAYDSVEKPETCPICGKKLPKLMHMRLLDAYICMGCAEKAGDMLHMGYDAIGCMCLSEIQPLFGHAAAQGGRADASGAFHDADSLRIVYPLIRTLWQEPGEYGYKVEYIDPLDSLSDEELKAAPALAAKRREELEEKYGTHKAIFEVDSISKLYNESKGKRYYHDEYRIGGRVLMGNIVLRDQAAVKRTEGTKDLLIRKLGDCRKYSSDMKELKEGTEGGLFVESALSFVYPGDILYID